MKEAIALGEESKEEIDTNSVIEAFEKEVEEITSQVNQSIEAAKDHLKARIAKGEAESFVPSDRISDGDDRSRAPTATTISSLAIQRRQSYISPRIKGDLWKPAKGSCSTTDESRLGLFWSHSTRRVSTQISVSLQSHVSH